jgi:predicted component of type VI protein secretion system
VNLKHSARSDSHPRTLLDKFETHVAHKTAVASRPIRETQTLIRNTLTFLLNANQYTGTLPEECPELEHSLLTYGLPTVIEQDGDAMAAVIQQTIERHEPRLRNVHVTWDGQAPTAEDTWIFIVHAESTTHRDQPAITVALEANRRATLDDQDATNG